MRYRERQPQQRRSDNKRHERNNEQNSKRDKPKDFYNHNHVVVLKYDRDENILRNFDADSKKKVKGGRQFVLFFDSLAAARNALPEIQAKAKQCDGLNIVIRAEAPMDDPELTRFGKVFAGAAWTLIHERRAADGYYSEPEQSSNS